MCFVLQAPVVDSPARRPVKGRASSPADVPTAATQLLASVSTEDNVKTVIRVATVGAAQPVRQVGGETLTGILLT